MHNSLSRTATIKRPKKAVPCGNKTKRIRIHDREKRQYKATMTMLQIKKPYKATQDHTIPQKKIQFNTKPHMAIQGHTRPHKAIKFHNA